MRIRDLACLVAAAWLATSTLAAGQPGRAPSPVADVPSPAATPTPSGAPLALTLEEAVALGLRQNRTIRSAQLQRVVERFDLFVAQRAFTPVGELSAQAARRRTASGQTQSEWSLTPSGAWRTPLGAAAAFLWDRSEPLEGIAGDARSTLSLQLRQPLLRGAGLDVNLAPVRIARLQEEINRLRLKATVMDAVTAVVLAYRGLIQAQEQVRLAQLSLERTRALLETNHALIDAGRMAAADIVQTESGVASQEVALLEAQRRLASSQIVLLRLLALDPRTNVRAADEIVVRRAEVDMEAAVELALAGRVDVLAQRKAIEQMRHAATVARNNRLWDLSVVGSATRQDGDWGPGVPVGRTDSTVGLSLSIPLGDYSARQADLAARTGLQTAELRYEDLADGVKAQIRDSVEAAESSWRQLEAARRAQALAARALELQQEKLRVGRASNFEVLSFQADLRTADSQELAARIAYLNALTALDQQIGSTLETWRISLQD